MKVFTLSVNGNETGLRVLSACGFFSRLAGLIFSAKTGHALLIPRCRAVHTLFMKYSLDIAFLDGKNSVVEFMPCVPPWKPLLFALNARSVLEIPAGVVPSKLEKGDRLGFRPSIESKTS